MQYDNHLKHYYFLFKRARLENNNNNKRHIHIYRDSFLAPSPVSLTSQRQWLKHSFLGHSPQCEVRTQPSRKQKQKQSCCRTPRTECDGARRLAPSRGQLGRHVTRVVIGLATSSAARRSLRLPRARDVGEEPVTSHGQLCDFVLLMLYLQMPSLQSVSQSSWLYDPLDDT